MSFPAVSHVGDSSGYVPAQSIELNGVSQYFSRTFDEANVAERCTATIAFSVKRASIGTQQAVFSNDNSGSDYTLICFSGAGDALEIYLEAANYGYAVTVDGRVFRDVTAWYQFVIVIDTTLDTPENRVRIWVNGVAQIVVAKSGMNFPTQNWPTHIGAAIPHAIGRFEYLDSAYLDGCICDFALLPGLALDESHFGEFDASGVWRPISIVALDYSGTNGCLLRDSSGVDASGNNPGNDFTPNDMPADVSDVPADDTPTDRGNQARLSAVWRAPGSTLSRSGREIEAPAIANHYPVACHVPLSGKKKWNVKIATVTNYWCVGLCTAEDPVMTFGSANMPGQPGWDADSVGLNFGIGSGMITQGGTDLAVYPDAILPDLFVSGDVANFAFDDDVGKLWIGRNGVWFNEGQPDAGGGPIATLDASREWFICLAPRNGASMQLEVDIDAHFTSTAPDADTFGVVSTSGLPAKKPTIPQAQIGVVTWTGTSVDQVVSGLGFEPDFIWTKARNSPENHRIFDSVRGLGTKNKEICSNNTGIEGAATSCAVTATRDGFSFSDGSSTWAPNYTDTTYVAWCFGGLTRLDNAGIADLVSLTGADIMPSAIAYDADLGFAMIKFPCTGSVGTLPNPLGVAPAAMIGKNLGNTTDWPTYFRVLGATKTVWFNTPNGAITHAVWSNTPPTASLITINGSGYSLNYSGSDAILYLFADTDAIKVGSYTGNGNVEGPFVNLGGKPLLDLVKRIDTAGNWRLTDAVRDPVNPTGRMLYPNLAASEDDYRSFYPSDFLAAGLKRRTSLADFNASGGTYVYLALLKDYFGGTAVTQGKAR